MDIFVIEKNENYSEKLKEFMLYMKFDKKYPVILFDIHKTTLTQEGEINKPVLITIRKLLKKKYQVIFLSYVGRSTGRPERIRRTVEYLNKENLYKSIPKFFIKKRIKHHFMKQLDRMINVRYMVLIDDNSKNIEDVKRLKDKRFRAILFQGKISIDDII